MARYLDSENTSSSELTSDSCSHKFSKEISVRDSVVQVRQEDNKLVDSSEEDSNSSEISSCPSPKQIQSELEDLKSNSDNQNKPYSENKKNWNTNELEKSYTDHDSSESDSSYAKKKIYKRKRIILKRYKSYHNVKKKAYSSDEISSNSNEKYSNDKGNSYFESQNKIAVRKLLPLRKKKPTNFAEYSDDEYLSWSDIEKSDSDDGSSLSNVKKSFNENDKRLADDNVKINDASNPLKIKYISDLDEENDNKSLSESDQKVYSENDKNNSVFLEEKLTIIEQHLDSNYVDNKKGPEESSIKLDSLENKNNISCSNGKDNIASLMSGQDSYIDLNDYLQIQSFVHSQVYQVKGKGYICYKCGQKKKRRDTLETHLLTHLVIKPFSCLYCNFETAYISSINHHKKLHPEYNKSLTKWDTFINTTNSNFEVPKPISEESLAIKYLFKCLLCSFKSNEKKSVFQHYGNKHKEFQFQHYGNKHKEFQFQHKGETSRENNSHLKFSCSYCPFISTSIKSLSVHKSTKHPLGKRYYVKNSTSIYKCDLCPFETCSFRGLRVHLTFKHAKNNSSLLLAIQQAKNNSPLKFSCSYCPFITTTLNSLNAHSSRTHPLGKRENAKFSTIFKCVYCAFETSSKNGLRTHIGLKHAKLKRESMNHLKKTSKTLKLKQHLVSKLKEKDFNDSAVKMEDSKQCNIKTFPCSKCSHVAISLSGLNIHLSYHKKFKNVTFSKVFSCKLCPYKAMNPKSLASHYKISHRKRQLSLDRPMPTIQSCFACYLCDFNTKNKYGLEIHFGKKHKGKEIRY